MSTDWQKEWWEKDHIPFHRTDVHPYLIEYLELLNLDKGANILIPLCGKSVDMIYLRDKGFNVYGADLSHTALEQFSDEHEIEWEVEKKEKYSIYRSPGLTYFLGDFFDLEINDLPKTDFILDRATMVALEPSVREKYVQCLIDYCRNEKLQWLLITFEHDSDKTFGPPFQLPVKEIEKLCENKFSLKILKTEEEEKISDYFLELGVSRIDRNCLLMKRQ